MAANAIAEIPRTAEIQRVNSYGAFAEIVAYGSIPLLGGLVFEIVVARIGTVCAQFGNAIVRALAIKSAQLIARALIVAVIVVEGGGAVVDVVVRGKITRLNVVAIST